jgi:hypothetical protein
VNAAAQLAEEHLARALPRRWKHVQAVAATAQRVALVVGNDGGVPVAAARLHDICYASDLVDGISPVGRRSIPATRRRRYGFRPAPPSCATATSTPTASGASRLGHLIAAHR